MRVTAGALVAGIGMVHNLLGFVLGAAPLLEILSAGGFNAVTDDRPWRLAIFWFLWFGWALMLLGGTWHWAERSGLTLPRWGGAALIALGLGGAFFMPVSGFWLVVPVGVWVLWGR